VRIIADVASGLHAAHELRDVDGIQQNLVHRDVSPHNILISTSGQVKLVDFGVAKAVGRMSANTRSGQLKGKFGYMSPEQAEGLEVDRRSDIFALGIVLYELTTSRRLFRGQSDLDTLRLIVGGNIPRPSRLDPSYPPGLEVVVLRALERNREQRYQTAAALEEDLRAFLKEQRIVVPQTGVAGLLKRVMGARIEQRRRAVRKALKTLEVPDSQRPLELISNSPAFTPTGGDDSGVYLDPSLVTSISDVSSLSQVGPLPQAGSASGAAAGSSRATGLLLVVLLMAAVVLGYLLYETRLKSALNRSAESTSTNGAPNETSSSGAEASATSSGQPATGASQVPTLRLDELDVERRAIQDAGSDL
jgi:serine/threonine protein kinase